MASISLHQVVREFGGTPILRGVDLEIADGEFIVIVGPSGCGKSTLLNCIAGLDSVTRGEIRIGDRRVNELPPKDRDIAMVFQAYALYPNMTVRQNLLFGLEMRRVPKAEQAQALQRVAEMLHIVDLLDRRPAQLSGGQRQRVAMGRAMVRSPAAFLFDEPLSNLDAKLRVQMRAELKALHQRVRQTVVYVTHDQVEAMTLADRIVVMNGGRIEQVGEPQALYSRPANLFVAGFIGSPAMNFIPGEAQPAAGPAGLHLVTRDGSRFPLPTGMAIAPGQGLVVGVRPEDFSTAQDGPVQLKVDIVERTGDAMHLYGRLCGELFCVRLPHVAAIATGQTVGLNWPLERLHIFDAASGSRVGAAVVEEAMRGPPELIDAVAHRSR